MSAEALKRIRADLGEPSYERDGVLLYRGDCLGHMRRIEGPLLDLTVTSPPYNIGKEYDSDFGPHEYILWCDQWLREIARITTFHGAFWLNLGYFSLPRRAKAVPIPYLLWDHVPMYFVQEVVWHYGAGVAARTSFSPRNEKFLWYVKDPLRYTFNLDAVRDANVKYPAQRKHGRLKCNPKGKNPSDVWDFAKVTSGENRSSKERTSHPAQFPLAVVDRIIKACSNRGDVVFDPFLGSGTVAEAALANGRHAVGFEIRGDYLGIAAERLDSWFGERERACRQGVLFPQAEHFQGGNDISLVS